jgi:Uma2 family endonuclease
VPVPVDACYDFRPMNAASPLDPRLEHRRFTLEAYERMIELGILPEDEHLELIEGELIVTPPQGEEHSGEIGILTQELVFAYGRKFTVRPQCPLRGAPSSMPEPDLAVVRGDAAGYLARHPTGADVVLLVEVAKTSLAYDRRKAAVYARMGVPEYWLVDVEGRRVEVRTGPMKDGEYELTKIVGEEEELALPETSARLAVAGLFPAVK